MKRAVIDASLVVDLLLAGSEDLVTTVGAYQELHAPTHVDIECLSALRGKFLGGRIPMNQFAAAALNVDRMPITRHSVADLVPRIVSLTANATAYDAAYIALAEGLGADLLTADARLAKVPGIARMVRVL